MIAGPAERASTRSPRIAVVIILLVWTAFVYPSVLVELETPAAAPAGVLVLTDAWFPGWRVKVDGHSRPRLRVDHALQGAALSPGAHRVEFVYRPTDVTVGGAITLSAPAMLLALTLVPLATARRRRPRGLDEGVPPNGSATVEGLTIASRR